MSQRFIYSEKVDLYLKGKLSGSDRVAFEEQVRQDPLLQNEVKLQQEVFQAIGEARRANIKARLDQVSVEQSPWAIGSPFKIAAVVSALVVTSVGAYFALSPSENEILTQVDITSSEQPILKGQPTQAPQPVVVSEEIPDAVIIAPEESTLVAVADTRPVVPQISSPKSPTIRRPTVMEDFSEEAVKLDYSDFTVPQKQAMQTNTIGESDISVERVLDKVYPFHYQFYDDKLFLHGDFEQAPYKIIALNIENGRSLFLEYTDNYYLLQEKKEVSPLILIQDTTLLKELRRLSMAN
ncbi:MAG: hypothetical protein AAF632_01785 [Bacteroidota bacterium]